MKSGSICFMWHKKKESLAVSFSPDDEKGEVLLVRAQNQFYNKLFFHPVFPEHQLKTHPPYHSKAMLSWLIQVSTHLNKTKDNPHLLDHYNKYFVEWQKIVYFTTVILYVMQIVGLLPFNQHHNFTGAITHSVLVTFSQIWRLSYMRVRTCKSEAMVTVKQGGLPPLVWGPCFKWGGLSILGSCS